MPLRIPFLSYTHIYSENNRMSDLLRFPSDFWYEATKIPTYSLEKDKEVFAIYKKIYSPYSIDLPGGILITYFDTELIRESMESLKLYPEQIILLIPENSQPLFQTSDEDFSDIWTQLSPGLDSSDSSYQSFRIQYEHTAYTASMVPFSEKDLYCVSLIPEKVLYRQTRSMSAIFLLLAGAACILSMVLSLMKTKREYSQLHTFIDLFQHADETVADKMPSPAQSKDLYQIILHNIVNLFLTRNYLRLQLDNKQYQIQLLELQTLQHQINPHFLFNTLNIIYWEAFRLTGGPNTCSSMISSLSEIVSYALTSSQEKVPIREELEYLHHYTDLQQIRYDNSFQVIWDVDEEAARFSIIKMIFQPLIENAVYHGIKERPENGIIKIKVFHQNHRIRIHILDNGAGIPAERLSVLRKQLTESATENASHIGLLNTNRRLTLTYGESSVIHLYSHHGMGTVLSFSIPEEAPPE